MTDSVQVLCVHAIKTMPDSISERKAVLRAMEKVLKASSPLYTDVQSQLAAIAAVEKLNSQMQMRFTGGKP